MSADHLVTMANDIGHYFAAESDRELAVNQFVKHLKSFWEPRMRRKIIAHLQAGGAGLEALPREAITRLAAETQTPG